MFSICSNFCKAFIYAIQTNVNCSKISPFVCGNISTNSVAKNYGRNSLSISQPEPRLFTEKVQLFIRFYYYSDSNIKVKFSEELPSPPPCLFFVHRTGQQLFSPRLITQLPCTRPWQAENLMAMLLLLRILFQFQHVLIKVRHK